MKIIRELDLCVILDKMPVWLFILLIINAEKSHVYCLGKLLFFNVGFVHNVSEICKIYRKGE